MILPGAPLARRHAELADESPRHMTLIRKTRAQSGFGERHAIEEGIRGLPHTILDQIGVWGDAEFTPEPAERRIG